MPIAPGDCAERGQPVADGDFGCPLPPRPPKKISKTGHGAGGFGGPGLRGRDHGLVRLPASRGELRGVVAEAAAPRRARATSAGSSDTSGGCAPWPRVEPGRGRPGGDAARASGFAQIRELLPMRPDEIQCSRRQLTGGRQRRWYIPEPPAPARASGHAGRNHNSVRHDDRAVNPVVISPPPADYPVSAARQDRASGRLATARQVRPGSMETASRAASSVS